MGSLVHRSLPISWTAAVATRRLSGAPAASRLDARAVKVDVIPANRQAFPDPASCRQHHQRQIRQVPPPSRLAGLQRGEPLLTFLGGQRPGLSSRTAFDQGSLSHRVDRHRAVSGSQTHQAGDHDFRRTGSTDWLLLIAANTRSTTGVVHLPYPQLAERGFDVSPVNRAVGIQRARTLRSTIHCLLDLSQP